MSGSVGFGGISRHIAGVGVDSFTPAKLPGLVLWVGARMETAYANNDAVSTMTDKSPQGNNLTQTGSNRPTFKTGIINGQPTYNFDGTNDYAFNATPTGMTNWTQSDFTAIAVIRPSSVVEEDILSSSNSGDGHMLLMAITTGRGHAWRGAGDANASNTSTTLLVNTNYILSEYVTSTTISMYLNATVETGPTNLTGTAGTGVDQIYVGNRSGVYAGGWYSGDIAEILIYTTSPSAAQMTQVLNFLNAFYKTY